MQSQILIDYVHVVVHVFGNLHSWIYDIEEGLWEMQNQNRNNKLKYKNLLAER
jgi:ribosomal silencing factor RsfS